MIINYYYYWGGGGAGNKVKRCGEKEKRKKALRGKRFIYYNNLYQITYKNPVRKVKPKKTKTNLIIKGNNNRQIRELPGVSTPNIIELINP